MTMRLTVSVPDEVGAWINSHRNASATVTDAVRAQMADAEARRAKRRQDALVYSAWALEHLDGEAEVAEQSNALSLGEGSEW